MYTYVFIEYGEACDGFPRIFNKAFITKEEAFQAMENQAKIDCYDTGYYYDVVGPGEKICIYEEHDDDSAPDVIMALCVVEIPGGVNDLTIINNFAPSDYLKPPFTITC